MGIPSTFVANRHEQRSHILDSNSSTKMSKEKINKVKIEKGNMVLKSVLIQTIMALHLGDDTISTDEFKTQNTVQSDMLYKL